MKLFRTVLLALALTAGVTAWHPATVQASAADEKSLERVEKELDSLWDYVDSSGSVTDEVFYPEFSRRARHAQDELAKTEQELARTSEKHEARKVVGRLREDVQQMQVALIAWRAAADAKDAAGFEDASYLLTGIIDIYNEDVEAYNSATHGARALAQLALHLSPLVVAFAASSILFAVAFYKNNETEDVLAEIRRQLRWHLWYASLFVLVTAAIPLYLYFFTPHTLPAWGWLALLGGFLPAAYVVFRYFKVRRLAKRP